MGGPLPQHDPHGERKGLVRGRLQPYAEVLRDDHPEARAFAVGKLASQPGRLLRQYLDESGGVYEFKMPIIDSLRADARELATLNGDAELMAAADQDYYLISLEHLRGLDPDKTRIVCGLRLQYTQDESKRLRLLERNPEPPMDERVYLLPQ